MLVRKTEVKIPKLPKLSFYNLIKSLYEKSISGYTESSLIGLNIYYVFTPKASHLDMWRSGC
jgi:hypothetical protein